MTAAGLDGNARRGTPPLLGSKADLQIVRYRHHFFFFLEGCNPGSSEDSIASGPLPASFTPRAWSALESRVIGDAAVLDLAHARLSDSLSQSISHADKRGTILRIGQDLSCARPALHGTDPVRPLDMLIYSIV